MSFDLRSQFLLDPDVVFLNHGSFGACPRPVFETYQRYQLELERRPIEFLGRRHDQLMSEARGHLAEYLNVEAENLAFVTNATAGINVVARSLPLQSGDEILTTKHEYGSLNYTWQYVAANTGARYIQHPIPPPYTTTEAFVEAFWEAVTPRTRVIYISHITSPTALIFPIEAICRRARAEGILTVIDGAHAPGQVPIDLTALGADFYSGNCHKWMCAPKGAGFLYARPEHQAMLKPLVISWGWTEESSFVDRFERQGTRDISPFLSVPAAIDFMAQHNWDSVRRDCHALAVETAARIGERTGLEMLSTNPDIWFNQMVTVPLPPCDTEDIKRRLYDDFHIEIPMVTWNENPYVRISIQGYNTSQDADALVDALTLLLDLG
jgi:isopenicillin-N epimerase